MMFVLTLLLSLSLSLRNDSIFFFFVEISLFFSVSFYTLLYCSSTYSHFFAFMEKNPEDRKAEWGGKVRLLWTILFLLLIDL